MSTQMGDFLLKLSQDPILSERYKDDPHSVMSDFNLTQEEISLLIEADTQALHSHFRYAQSKVATPVKPKPTPRPPKPRK